MNVLLIVTGLANSKNPSGSSYNNRFARALQAKGLNVKILHLRALSPFRLPIKLYKNSDNINIIELSCYLLFSSKKMPIFITFIVQIYLSLLKKTHIRSIDTIHAISGGAIIPAYIFSKHLKAPFISQFIGSDIMIQANYFSKMPLFNKALAASHTLCFNSKTLQKDFDKVFSIDKERKVFYRGIDLMEFPVRLNVEDNILRILFLGGFPVSYGNLKGGVTLLNTINQLAEFNFSIRIEIIIGGPNSMLQMYQNQLNLNQRNKSISVKFVGSLQRNDVIAQLYASNIVLIPSLSEGIPNVLYEAMATNNAIIASRVGGIPEFIDRKSGILIESGNEEELANAIIQLVMDETARNEFAIAARDKIQRHDYKNFVNGYLSLYSATIKN